MTLEEKLKKMFELNRSYKKSIFVQIQNEFPTLSKQDVVKVYMVRYIVPNMPVHEGARLMASLGINYT